MTEFFDPLQNPDQEAYITARFQAISRTLGQVVGEVHSRLRDPKQRVNMGDMWVSDLTYGEIIEIVPDEERQGTPEDLPEGFERSEDPLVVLPIMEHHIAAINTYLTDSTTSMPPVELAGHKLVDLSDADFSLLHPYIGGYSWYRGHQVTFENASAVLFLMPWMQPFHRGGSPFPIVYTKGSHDSAELRSVTEAYSRARISHSRAGNQQDSLQ